MREKYDEVIEQMNRAGAEGTPFLFVLDYEKSEGFFIPNPLEHREVLFCLGEQTNIKRSVGVRRSGDVSFKKKPLPLEEYAKRFEIVQRGMRDGSSVLANLTVATPIETSLSLEEILYATKATYQLYIPEARFVCFSPEQFVKVDCDGTISTCPMKGTITSDVPGAPDVILNDYKETSEHCAVVDLLRRDLSGVAEDVRVERFRFFTEIQTQEKRIYQVSSEIRGVLPGEWRGRIGSTIGGMLPAGSILGAPRDGTRRLIAEAERGIARGYYCGVFGYYDGHSVDSAVLIRCVVEDEKGQKFYHSGGGITINSLMEKEYREVIEKIYLPVE